MEILGPILGMLSQLAFIGLIAWAIVHAVSRRDPDAAPVDRAAQVRRVFVYGLLSVTMILGAIGLTMTGGALLTADWGDDDRTSLALGLAFALVAGPAYALLLRHTLRRLRDDDAESTSAAWTAYLDVALTVSLIVSMITLHGLLIGVFGVDEFTWRSLAAPLVWGGIWAAHWFWLRPAHGIRGDLHLAVGSLTGLATMMIGLGGITYAAAGEIYEAAVEAPPPGYEAAAIAPWLITAAVGSAVWGWHWLGRYRTAERSTLWHVHVLLMGVLGGLLVAVAAGATMVYRTTVWLIGDASADLPSMHFEHAPAAAGFLVAGFATWLYHRAVLGDPADLACSETTRSYDYVMAGSGLGAIVAGATVGLVALLEEVAAGIIDEPTGIANRLILALVLVAIGAPIWWEAWSRVSRNLAVRPEAEANSAARRIYLITLFGIGGLTALISLIVVLFVGLDDVLNDTFGGDTLDSARVGLALLLTVTGVAWYHLCVFRTDRAAARRTTPAVRYASVSVTDAHVVLIAPRDGELADTLSAATGVPVETWTRDDQTVMPEIDLDDLVTRILENNGHEVAVVIREGGAEVIPYTP